MRNNTPVTKNEYILTEKDLIAILGPLPEQLDEAES